MPDRQIMLKIYREFPDLLNLRLFVPGDERHVCEQYDFDSCWTTENPEASMARVDVAAAIIVCGGHYADVARVLRRNRSSVQNMVVRDKELFSIRQDHKDGFIDDMEKLHMGAALRGDLGAQRFFLTTLGKDRGYVTRAENTGKDGVPLVAPTLTKEALKGMTPEVLEALLKARDVSEKAEAEDA